LRENSSIVQIRQSKINEKIIIKYNRLETNSDILFQSSQNINNKNSITFNNWNVISKYNNSKYNNIETNQILIYTYSLSNNLIKETVTKMGVKLILTKEIKKATLIIGFKKHLKQNFKVKNLAIQKNIPIYSVNHRSVFQLIKLILFILSK